MIHRKMTRPRHPTNTQTSPLRVPAPRNCAKFSAERSPQPSRADPRTRRVRPTSPPPLRAPLGKTLLVAWPDSGCLEQGFPSGNTGSEEKMGLCVFPYAGPAGWAQVHWGGGSRCICPQSQLPLRLALGAIQPPFPV